MELRNDRDLEKLCLFGSRAPYGLALRADPCSYCGGPGGTLDHIVPRSKGGMRGWTNLTGACQACNERKGSRSAVVFMAQGRLRRPVRRGLRASLGEVARVH